MVPAALLAACLALTGDTSHETATATAPPTPTSTLTPPTPPAAASDLESLLDRSHDAVTRELADAIGWFDDFFADDERREFERNDSALLLRQELRVEDAPRLAPRTDLRLDLRLPQLGERFRRWHVVVYAQTVANGVAQDLASLVPFRGGAAGPALADPGDPSQGSAELRLDLVRALLAHVDVGGGVHIDLPPGGYVRMRLRSTFGLAPRTLGRVTASAFYDSAQRLGTATHGAVEHRLGAATLLRLDGVASVTGVSRGWEWGGQASALRALDARYAVGASAGLLGHGGGGATIDTYRVATRLRAQAWRDWFYVEVEPEVAWPLDALTLARHRVFAVTFRLDVQFGASAARPPDVAPVQGARDTP